MPFLSDNRSVATTVVVNNVLEGYEYVVED